MAKFRFKLESVLAQRQRVEDERQRELAKLLRERFILETELRHMQEAITADKVEMSGELVGRVDVGRIRAHANHANQVTLRAQQIAVRMMGLEKQIEAARGKLLDATKGRKAIELLKDKQLKRWQTELDRRERETLDEMAVQRFGRLTEGAY